MDIALSKMTGPGLFFLVVFLSGFWLNRRGSPYSMLVVTLHKLIGLAVGISLGRTVYRIHEMTPLSPVQLAAVVVTVLFFAVNVVTGSLLSTNKPMPRAVSTVNKFFPYLTLVSTGVMIYLLAQGAV